MKDELLTAQEAAALLHLHVKRVQALARDGRLPGVRAGRKWLFPRRKLLEALRVSEADTAPPIDISARNQLKGTIEKLEVDGLMAEIRLQIGDQGLVAVITRSSVERLKLKVGDEAYAVIKSTEVMIGKRED
jgi:molybdopterin-binding protein